MNLLRPAVVTSSVDPRHWRVVLGRLHATFATGTFERGAALVARVAELADRHGHHPDVDLRYTLVHVAVVSHDAGGLTERDVALAAGISEIADALGVDAVRTDAGRTDAGRAVAGQALEIAVDALDIAAVQPFWRAVLGYVDERPEAPDASPALVDPAGIGPAVWFQQMDAPRPQRNRVHLDVSVPHDVAVARVEAALAAGGRLVSDRRAPAFWVLADAEGNEACVCTWQGREGA
ncbi:VOC family protein [Actinotalea sp.]|uniref:VOC family protein n=1 Tax=Actinotalea sp. TaxID=1872145 RepID=UPI002C6FE293|nr:VOC family protein [Actinotalea sp.]HQY32847.1 VOC family protein [Actinotalea sp.]HRA51618.1 VOC family protein [Actinotalea sp.]